MKSNKGDKIYKVQSLEKGLEIFEILAASSHPMALREISQSANFSRSTTHRILDALKNCGYVNQSQEDLKYRPSFKAFELGNAIIRRLNLRDTARPILKSLSQETGEASLLIIIDNDECLCLERIEGPSSMKATYLQIGGRLCLHIGAGPKSLLSFLPDNDIDRILSANPLVRATDKTIIEPGRLWREIHRIRKKGYALSYGEKTLGAGSLGFPVYGLEQKAVAAIAITGYAENFKGDRLSFLIDRGRNAAKKLSNELGGSKR